MPGVIGGICLLVALYAFQILPVNYAGLALIALGLALVTVELFLPSFGILGIGGVVAVVTGSVILFEGDTPEFRINTALIAGMGVASALIFAVIVWVGARSCASPGPAAARHGRPGSRGHPGLRDGLGRVHVRGEDWSARCEQPVRRGDKVRIVAMEGEGLV